MCYVCLIGFWRGFDNGGQIKLCFLFFEIPGAAGSVNGPGCFLMALIKYPTISKKIFLLYFKKLKLISKHGKNFVDFCFQNAY